jgi:hypothetical protein
MRSLSLSLSLDSLVLTFPHSLSKVPMNFTLRNALDGKQVIEYPTFIIGPDEFLTKVEYFVKELSASERSEGEEKGPSQPQSSKRQLVDVVSGGDPNEIDLHEAPVKQQKLFPSDGEEEDFDEQHAERGVTVPLDGVGEEGEEEEDDGGGEEFIKELEWLQSQDISSLHELIASMETTQP